MDTIRRFSAEEIKQYRTELSALLRDAVEGGASVSFMAPLADEVASSFWSTVAIEVEVGDRIVLVARKTETHLALSDSIVGCAHLVFSSAPNGIYRAEVQKVLVHTSCRRQGLGRALMAAVEAEAVRAGKKLLVLDTARDGGAEPFYEQCGYVRAGAIPQFALAPYGGLVDTVFFYRLLPSPFPHSEQEVKP